MFHEDQRFKDRAEAGRELGQRLAELKLERPVVYGLPRGGIPVALEVSRSLGAPLDLIFVRKIGAPGSPEVALAAIVDGAHPQMVINESVRRHSHADESYIEQARARELKELERRRSRYMGARKQVDATGRTAIVVDDGLATGATMKAALLGLRQQGAEKVVIAVPVAPVSVLPEFDALADQVICLNPSDRFFGVGAFYDDFHQLSDEEAVTLLKEGWESQEASKRTPTERRALSLSPHGLAGDLIVPPNARGLVIFAHGSGSSRLSPRNQSVADRLNAHGFATLLFDLLTVAEAEDRRNVFDIPLLAERVLDAVRDVGRDADVSGLPVGLFGASTGAAAALVAAARLKGRIGAVVSRGGRPDLAGERLADVTAPTLLIVGGEDHDVIALNRDAQRRLTCDTSLEIVPQAGHLFEGPGQLEAVSELAADWFARYLNQA